MGELISKWTNSNNLDVEVWGTEVRGDTHTGLLTKDKQQQKQQQQQTYNIGKLSKLFPCLSIAVNLTIGQQAHVIWVSYSIRV